MEKKAKFQIKERLYQKYECHKTPLNQVRAKADTKRQLKNMKSETCREREKKRTMKAFQEEQTVSIVTKHNVLSM